MNNFKRKSILLIIIIIGAFFRFTNLNWDRNHHLHPDERFLTMVGNVTKIPTNLSSYFNQQLSTLNPRNVGHSFFVYGNLPLIINKVTAVKLDHDNYDEFTTQGRFLAAVFDLMIIVLVYKTVFLLEKKYSFSKQTKNWAALFYALAVLPIQQSHFFTADNFLNFFTFASFYFALSFNFKKQIKYLALSASSFALALACKLSALYILPLNLFLVINVSQYCQFLFTVSKTSQRSFASAFAKIPLAIIKDVIKFIIYLLIVYFTLRLADPYLFDSPNFLNPKINDSFITNIKNLKQYDNAEGFYPPAIQWIKKEHVSFALANLSFLGLGLVPSLLAFFGMSRLVQNARKKFLKYLPLVLTYAWMAVFFIYQSSQFVKALRYFLIIYPLLAILAALGASLVTENFFTHINKNYKKLLLVFVSFIWPLMFMSIYLHKNSRIQASEWIYQNLEKNSIILVEAWDDPLPLTIDQQIPQNFRIEMIPIFDPDSASKWQSLNQKLKQADYYILSSNRAWGSIPTVPEKYPQTAKFYEKLLAGETNYQKIAEFSSYPSLKYLKLPIEINDDLADETFTVYDHPKVIIFKNNAKN